MKTISEIAKELGVTRQAIYQRIKRKPLSILLSTFTPVNGFVNIEVENAIKSAFCKQKSVDTFTVDVNTVNKSVNVYNENDNMFTVNTDIVNESVNKRALTRLQPVNKSVNVYSPVNSFDINLLGNVKGNNGQYTALCPAHDDKNNSLSIKITNDRVLLHCHAGCSTESIMSALGLPMTALFTEEKPQKPKIKKQKVNTITYEYKTADGSIAYRKQRYEFSDGSKSFAFYTPNGEKGRGGKSYPYNLSAVLSAEIIYFCEGEKCVDAITKTGRVATSLDAGANSIWKKEYNTYFENKTVIILPDNDDPGMLYANKIASELPGSKIIKLPDLQKGGDIYYWLQMGHVIEELDELPAVEPELPEPETIIQAENIPGFIPINPFESAESRKRYGLNQVGLGNIFADCFKNLCRFCPETKNWFIYNGRVWREDTGGMVSSQFAKSLIYYLFDCRKFINDEERRDAWLKYVTKNLDRKLRDIMLKDASSVHYISIKEFDKDPNLLNVENGTIDLRTFTLRPHNPDDFLSKIANVTFDENARCDRWERFITEIMQDDSDKAQFVQKALGYSLTGDTSEECFFIFYGSTTRNGKGTTAETILHIMGDYGRTAQPETIAQKQTSNGGAPSEDVARLKGARFVNMSEPDKGLRLNSALVKSMTGGDTITARFLHQNSFEFKPEYKLFINTNHLPRVTDDSIFASGRVKLIPFERHFPENEQDKNLKAFFRQPQNRTGILNWLLTGLQLLKAEGLKQPQSVLNATAQYREDSDIIGQFISECLVEKPDNNTLLKNVHTVYEIWCKDNGYGILNSHNLSAELKRKGKKVERRTGNKVYLLNYALISDRDDIPLE